jgi:hypothetical protein
MHVDTFKNLEKLRVLFLPQNHLRWLDKDLLKNNLKLEIVHFYNNSLAALHYKMFSHLDHIVNLGLVNCTCINEWFDERTISSVENKLRICGTGYGIQELNERSLKTFEEKTTEKLEKQSQKIDGNFEYLSLEIQKIKEKHEFLGEKFSL